MYRLTENHVITYTFISFFQLDKNLSNCVQFN